MLIEFSSKYKALDNLGTRYCVITGGRGSGKSFKLSVHLLLKTYNKDEVVLFTRYTMTSAELSIIPEFWEKVEMLGLADDFSKSNNTITNIHTGSKIIFRGLKTSSGVQTANLKSINGVTCWVLDEAEEMVDEVLFDKIDLSVRKIGIKNEIILVLNPSNKNHFMYRRFFANNNIKQVTNGVAGDITYIHTSYLDNLKNLDSKFIELANKCKEVDADKYNNVFLGEWADKAEGLIYKNWKAIKEFPAHLPVWYGVDWGFSNDQSAVVRIAYDDGNIYLHEVLYKKEMLVRDIQRAIKDDFKNRKIIIDDNTYIEQGILYINGTGIAIEEYNGGDSLINKIKYDLENSLTDIYCDPARPEHIREMRAIWSLLAHKAVNADKVGRIEFIKYFNVHYTSESNNIAHEMSEYRWRTHKQDTKVLINEPMDGNDHLMDAINYGVVTHLRRLGVQNNLGDN